MSNSVGTDVVEVRSWSNDVAILFLLDIISPNLVSILRAVHKISNEVSLNCFLLVTFFEPNLLFVYVCKVHRFIILRQERLTLDNKGR